MPKQHILTEDEYLALKFPARKNRERQVYTPIEGEKWKKIDGANGIYYNSNKGRFRKIYKTESGKINDFILRLRALNGSMGVTLTISPGNIIGYQAARVILATWRPNEEPKFVLYKDGNYKNLELSNLAWASRKEINAHKRTLGQLRQRLVTKTYKTAYGKIKTRMVLFSEKEKEQMRDMYAKGINQVAIADKFGATQAYVSKVVNPS